MGERLGGSRHEAAIYGSDEELVALAVPFLRAGVLAGEPTLVGLADPERRLVLDALGAVAEGTAPLAPGPGEGGPFVALEHDHRRVTGALALTAGRVRVLRQVPVPGLAPDAWDGWARYEAALDHVYEPLAVWSLCAYDRRLASDEVLADVTRTHTHLASAEGGHRASPDHVEPASFLAGRARDDVDPLESGPPDLVRTDPTPAGARRAVAALVAGTDLDDATGDRLVLAVSELVTNAVVHGRPPVALRAWAADDRVVVTVRDSGPGPADPFVGLLPRRDSPIGGLGLWMVNQSCARVALLPADDGFTVRVTAGAPAPRPHPG